MLQELAKVSGVKGATHAHRALINLLECFAENPEAFRQVKMAIPTEYAPRAPREFLLNEPAGEARAKQSDQRSG